MQSQGAKCGIIIIIFFYIKFEMIIWKREFP